LVVRYHFAQGGRECDAGAPANDNFADATLLSQASGEVQGSNATASGEVGEPRHAGSAPDTSVWYRWKAPFTGTAALSTTDSSFNTTLAVYRGESLSSLTAVAANDNMTGSRASRVVFRTVGGSTYRIAVDGVDGASGSIRLKWRLSLKPPEEEAPIPDGPAKDDSGSGSPTQPHVDPTLPVAPER
jgi:hypothetical protein